MAVCFRSPAHDGPFHVCAVCGRTVCHACVGRVLPDRTSVRCIECEVVARRLDPDRYKHPAYRGEVLLTTPRTSPLRALAGGFAGIGHFIIGGLTAPFRRTWDPRGHSLDLRVDVSYSSFRDKLLAVGLFGLFLLVLIIFGALYADLNMMPLWRVLLYFIASSVAGMTVAVYARYLTDRPLGVTASTVASYFLAMLVAIMVLAVLFEL